ncbi:MAG: ABC transporter ATP-binding protein [Deltaproteobacteria bacterium]|nr:ABC transporter ATP-binding protein [Deltaproteobacteria bacterium]
MRLEAKDLGISIGTQKILNDINIQIGHNRFNGIIGPNGSGKSTLLRSLFNVLRPDCGYISFNDRVLTSYKRIELAKNIAVVPQQQSLFEITVEKVIQMGLYPHKSFFEKISDNELKYIDHIIDLLGLNKLKNRDVTTLSGGERQMVLLARALAQKTPILLLDEPTNHLDIYYQILFLDNLKSLDKLLVVVFHDLNLASKYCDHLFLMSQGTIIGEGSPQDILTKSIIRQVYGLDVEILENPKTGKPVVVL